MAGIKAIICTGDKVVVDHIEKAMPQCPTVKSLISTGPIVPEGWYDFNKSIAEAAPFVRPEKANSNDDISLLYFTSGTTGEPKMVAHDFTYPLGHIITASYWHNLSEDSLHLTLADTGWGKAVWGKLYGQWIAGANVFVYDFEKFEPVDVLHMIHNYGITSFCAPPTVFRFLIREDLSKFDLSTLKYCTIAGEALNPKVYEEWLKLTGIKLMEGFGQTETTLTIATYPWIEPKPGSMGKKGPQYDIDLIAPTVVPWKMASKEKSWYALTERNRSDFSRNIFTTPNSPMPHIMTTSTTRAMLPGATKRDISGLSAEPTM